MRLLSQDYLDICVSRPTHEMPVFSQRQTLVLTYMLDAFYKLSVVPNKLYRQRYLNDDHMFILYYLAEAELI